MPSSDYPNIRADIKRKESYSNEKSIASQIEYYDCVNINGPVDNSGCSAENSLCSCPCTGGNTFASAVPLFREPSEAEMQWAKDSVSLCAGENWDGYFILNPEGLESDCGAPCHGKNFHSFYNVMRTYSTFWDTPKKTPLYRNALVNLYTTEQAVCIIPGNLKIKVGDFIFLPSDGSSLAEKYSGGWLISNITHTFASLQQYKMILTLIRDNTIIDPLGEEG